LKAPQDVANEMGEDYEDVLVAIKAAQDMAARLGVAPEAAPSQPTQPKEPPP
jgi:capsid protein